MAGPRQQRGINQRRDPLRQSNRSGGHHLTHPDPLEAGGWWMADGGWRMVAGGSTSTIQPLILCATTSHCHSTRRFPILGAFISDKSLCVSCAGASELN